MQYKTFKIDHEEGINSFLKENSKFLARDSVILSESNISFLFDTEQPEEDQKPEAPKKNIYEVGLQKTIQTCLMEIVEKEMSLMTYKRRISQLEFDAESQNKSIDRLEREKHYKHAISLKENTETEIGMLKHTIESCTELLEKIKTGEFKLPAGYTFDQKFS